MPHENYREGFKNVLFLPERFTIIGLGGTGKRFLYQLVDYEYLLDNYNNPQKKLQLLSFDTDSAERIVDQNIESSIREKISSIGAQNSVTFNYYHLPELATIGSPDQLTDDAVVRAIKDGIQNPKVDFWWLHDTEKGWNFADLRKIDPNIKQDFSGGVARRRAISKAIFYKVLCQSAGRMPTFQNNSVAIIVGLGGGTGSGTFMDMARFVRSQRPSAHITLFAILPSNNEQDAEKLNAAIALTELEYLMLNEDLFNFVILSSLDPTQYNSGIRNNPRVIEFDEAFPNILINFYNSIQADAFIVQSRYPYSQFYFATSHVIKYPINQLIKISQDFSSTITYLEDIKENRCDINEIVKKTLDESLLTKKQPPTPADINFIQQEYGRMKAIIDAKIVSSLGYRSKIGIEHQIKNNIPENLIFRDGMGFCELMEYLNILSSFPQQIEGQPNVDPNDGRLVALIPEYLRHIADMGYLFERINAIENPDEQNYFREILKGNLNIASFNQVIQTKSSPIESDFMTLQEQKNELSNKINGLKSEKESISSLAQQQVGNAVVQIQKYIELSSLMHLLTTTEDDLYLNIQKMLDQLNQIRTFTHEQWIAESGIGSIHSLINQLQQSSGYTRLTQLNSLLSSIVDYSYWTNRAANLPAANRLQDPLRRGHQQAIQHANGESAKCMGIIQSNYRNWGFSLEMGNRITLTMPNFITHNINIEKDRVMEDIRQGLFGNFSQDDKFHGKFRNIFDSNNPIDIRSQIQVLLYETICFNHTIFERERLLQFDLENKEHEIASNQIIVQYLKSLRELDHNSNAKRVRYQNGIKDYLKYLENINQNDGGFFNGQDGDYQTIIGNIDPRIVGVINPSNPNASLQDLTDDNPAALAEIQRIRNLILQTYSKLYEPRRLGLGHNFISFANNSWAINNVRLIIASRSRVLEREIANEETLNSIRSDIVQTLCMRNIQNAGVMYHNNSKPWEITLTFIAATSFLDNIDPFINAAGYRTCYFRDNENILHHTLLLHEGKYVIRKQIIPAVEAAKLGYQETVEGVNLHEYVSNLYEVKNLLDLVKTPKKMDDCIQINE